MNKLDDVNKVIIKKLSILSMKLAMLDIKLIMRVQPE